MKKSVVTEIKMDLLPRCSQRTKVAPDGLLAWMVFLDIISTNVSSPRNEKPTRQRNKAFLSLFRGRAFSLGISSSWEGRKVGRKLEKREMM